MSLEETNYINQKAIVQNSVVPIRLDPSDNSEMVSQLLLGELCTILLKKNNWRRIRAEYDQYEGWVDYKHLIEIDDTQMGRLAQNVLYVDATYDLWVQNDLPFPVTIGAEIRNLNDGVVDFFGTQYSLNQTPEKLPTDKGLLPDLAFRFLNIPYLWGGKSSFGIDCSGFIQTLFKLISVKLPRDAYQQGEFGQVLSFIEEAEPGDLAFFDNEEGRIVHVGMLLKNHKIIHAHGKVRIDTLDYTGIYNAELKKHTHKLRFIRKVL